MLWAFLLLFHPLCVVFLKLIDKNHIEPTIPYLINIVALRNTEYTIEKKIEKKNRFY
jgi:hypothetical protein